MTRSIDLRLNDGVLQFMNESGQWQNVDADNPNTGVNEGDEIDWNGDASIDKIKIKPPTGAILAKVTGNDSKNPKGSIKSGLSGNLTQKYTISVKSVDQKGGYIDFDPKITFPLE